LNEITVKFKKLLSADNPFSPAVITLPLDAYERGCVSEGIVVAVDHALNTISVNVNGIVHANIPMYYHTDIGYASYVKAIKALPEGSESVFPSVALSLFANASRCFIAPSEGIVKRWSPSNETWIEPLSGTPKVLVFSYPSTDESEINTHVAFNIVSDWDESRISSSTKVNEFNRPTYWPHIVVKRTTTLADSSIETTFSSYDIETGSFSSAINVAGDARVSVNNLSPAEIDHWLATSLEIPSVPFPGPVVQCTVAEPRFVFTYGVENICRDGSVMWIETEVSNTQEYREYQYLSGCCSGASAFEKRTGVFQDDYWHYTWSSAFEATSGYLSGGADERSFIQGYGSVTTPAKASIELGPGSNNFIYLDSSYSESGGGTTATGQEFNYSLTIKLGTQSKIISGTAGWDGASNKYGEYILLTNIVSLSAYTDVANVFESLAAMTYGYYFSRMAYPSTVISKDFLTYSNLDTSTPGTPNGSFDTFMDAVLTGDETAIAIDFSMHIIYAPYDIRERTVI
jgi:hypothetical protein